MNTSYNTGSIRSVDIIGTFRGYTNIFMKYEDGIIQVIRFPVNMSQEAQLNRLNGYDWNMYIYNFLILIFSYFSQSFPWRTIPERITIREGDE